MRRHKTTKCTTILILLGIIYCSYINVAMAAEYLGEFCWNFTYDENATGPITPVSGISKYSVTHVGGGNYLVLGNGQIGSARIAGDFVLVTANSTLESEDPISRQARTAQWKLNVSTLSGTIWRTMIKFDTSSRSLTLGYHAGTATLVTCP